MIIKIRSHVKITDIDNGFSVSILESGFKGYYNLVFENCTDLEIGDKFQNVLVKAENLKEYLERFYCTIIEADYIKEIFSSLE